MARGWESKAVEAQQHAADSATAAAPRTPPDPAEIARRTRRELIQLARVRAAADLKAASAPAHRAMLEGALAELDRQLEALR